MKITRVTVDLDPTGYQELNQLVELYKTKTKAEAIRKAIREALLRSQAPHSEELKHALKIIDKISDELIRVKRKRSR